MGKKGKSVSSPEVLVSADNIKTEMATLRLRKIFSL